MAAAAAGAVVVVVFTAVDGTAGGGLNAEQSQSEPQHEPNRHPVAWRKGLMTSLGVIPTDRWGITGSGGVVNIVATASDSSSSPSSSFSPPPPSPPPPGAGAAAALVDRTGVSAGVCGAGAPALAGAVRGECWQTTGGVAAAVAVVAAGFDGNGTPCELLQIGQGVLEYSGRTSGRGGKLVSAVGVGLSDGGCRALVAMGPGGRALSSSALLLGCVFFAGLGLLAEGLLARNAVGKEGTRGEGRDPALRLRPISLRDGVGAGYRRR